MCHLPCMRWTLNLCVCSLDCRWCCTLQGSCVRPGRTLCHQTPAQECHRTPLKKQTSLFTGPGRERTEKESESVTERACDRDRNKSKEVETEYKLLLKMRSFYFICWQKFNPRHTIFSLFLHPLVARSFTFLILYIFFNRMLHRLSKKRTDKTTDKPLLWNMHWVCRWTVNWTCSAC